MKGFFGGKGVRSKRKEKIYIGVKKYSLLCKFLLILAVLRYTSKKKKTLELLLCNRKYS